MTVEEFRKMAAAGQYTKKGRLVVDPKSFENVVGKPKEEPKVVKRGVSPAPVKKSVTQPKRGKFGNIKVADPEGGPDYDSRLEAKHGAEYVMMLKSGKILKLTRQVRFLVERYEFSKKDIYYVADFLIDHLDGSQEVVDSKGVSTKEFKRKAKWFKARYPHIKFTTRTSKDTRRGK